MRGVFLGVCVLLIGCGVAPRGTVRPGESTSSDEAVELAGLLPRGTQTCVAARIGALPANRRALAAELAAAPPDDYVSSRFPTLSPLAWIPELDVTAIAFGRQAPADRPGGRVMLIRFRASRIDAERILATQRVERVFASESAAAACVDAECRASVGRATFLDDHTLRIVTGFWWSDMPLLQESECVDLLTATPNAFAVWDTGTAFGSPRVRATVAADDTRVVRLATPEHFASEPAEEIAAYNDRERRNGARRIVRAREEQWELTTLWEDLAFVAADATRLRVAMQAQGSRSLEIVPVQDVDVDNQEEFERQAQLRLAAGGQTADAELYELCVRRVAVAPWDAIAAERVVSTLWMRHDYAGVVEVADRAIDETGERPFAPAARAALSILDSSRFVDRLVADDLLQPAERAPFRSWLRSSRIVAREGIPIDAHTAILEFRAPRRVVTAALDTPIAADIEFVPAMLQMIAARQFSTTREVWLRISNVSPPVASDAVVSFDAAATLTFEGDVAVSWLVAPSPDAGLAVGRSIGARARGPRVQIAAYAAVAADAPRLLAACELVRSDSGAWVIERVSASVAALDWQKIRTGYFMPLHGALETVFPGPRVNIVFATERERTDVESALESVGASCGRDAALGLSCEVRSGSIEYVAAILALAALPEP